MAVVVHVLKGCTRIDANLSETCFAPQCRRLTTTSTALKSEDSEKPALMYRNRQPASCVLLMSPDGWVAGDSAGRIQKECLAPGIWVKNIKKPETCRVQCAIVTSQTIRSTGQRTIHLPKYRRYGQCLKNKLVRRFRQKQSPAEDASILRWLPCDRLSGSAITHCHFHVRQIHRHGCNFEWH